MLSNRFTKTLLFALSVIFLSVVSPQSSARAEIIDLDFSGLTIQQMEDDPGIPLATATRFVAAMRRAEAFWDARVLGYSNTLPREVVADLNGSLVIVVSNEDLGGGGTLGFAEFFTALNIVRGGIFRQRSVAVSQVAGMTFSNAFLESSTDDEITDVVIHEMGHALGIGGLWRPNGMVQRIGNGPEQYVGFNARRAFAIEAGVAGQARTGFVPIEQQGGGGTALVHWDDDSPIFNTIAQNGRIELMTGFFIPNTERFISRITLASLVDIHYVVRGFNEDELIEFPRVLANQLVPPTPLGGASSFRNNPFGANESLGGSSAAVRRNAPAKRVTPATVYRKRRR